jgi:DNA-binding transcriptional LysR family regulator
MSILVAAVEAGSFSAAARQLGTPLSTISRKVSDLEAHLKVRLLKRSGRKLTLTDAGRAYFEACKRILETSVKPNVPHPANIARRKVI